MMSLSGLLSAASSEARGHDVRALQNVDTLSPSMNPFVSLRFTVLP